MENSKLCPCSVHTRNFDLNFQKPFAIVQPELSRVPSWFTKISDSIDTLGKNLLLCHDKCQEISRDLQKTKSQICLRRLSRGINTESHQRSHSASSASRSLQIVHPPKFSVVGSNANALCPCGRKLHRPQSPAPRSPIKYNDTWNCTCSFLKNRSLEPPLNEQGIFSANMQREPFRASQLYRRPISVDSALIRPPKMEGKRSASLDYRKCCKCSEDRLATEGERLIKEIIDLSKETVPPISSIDSSRKRRSSAPERKTRTSIDVIPAAPTMPLPQDTTTREPPEPPEQLEQPRPPLERDVDTRKYPVQLEEPERGEKPPPLEPPKKRRSPLERDIDTRKYSVQLEEPERGEKPPPPESPKKKRSSLERDIDTRKYSVQLEEPERIEKQPSIETPKKRRSPLERDIDTRKSSTQRPRSMSSEKEGRITQQTPKPRARSLSASTPSRAPSPSTKITPEKDRPPVDKIKTKPQEPSKKVTTEPKKTAADSAKKIQKDTKPPSQKSIVVYDSSQAIVKKKDIKLRKSKAPAATTRKGTKSPPREKPPEGDSPFTKLLDVISKTDALEKSAVEDKKDLTIIEEESGEEGKTDDSLEYVPSKESELKKDKDFIVVTQILKDGDAENKILLHETEVGEKRDIQSSIMNLKETLQRISELTGSNKCVSKKPLCTTCTPEKVRRFLEKRKSFEERFSAERLHEEFKKTNSNMFEDSRKPVSDRDREVCPYRKPMPEKHPSFICPSDGETRRRRFSDSSLSSEENVPRRNIRKCKQVCDDTSPSIVIEEIYNVRERKSCVSYSNITPIAPKNYDSSSSQESKPIKTSYCDYGRNKCYENCSCNKIYKKSSKPRASREEIQQRTTPPLTPTTRSRTNLKDRPFVYNCLVKNPLKLLGCNRSLPNFLKRGFSRGSIDKERERHTDTDERNQKAQRAQLETNHCTFLVTSSMKSNENKKPEKIDEERLLESKKSMENKKSIERKKSSASTKLLEKKNSGIVVDRADISEKKKSTIKINGETVDSAACRESEKAELQEVVKQLNYTIQVINKEVCERDKFYADARKTEKEELQKVVDKLNCTIKVFGEAFSQSWECKVKKFKKFKADCKSRIRSKPLSEKSKTQGINSIMSPTGSSASAISPPPETQTKQGSDVITTPTDSYVSASTLNKSTSTVMKKSESTITEPYKPMKNEEVETDRNILKLDDEYNSITTERVERSVSRTLQEQKVAFIEDDELNEILTLSSLSIEIDDSKPKAEASPKRFDTCSNATVTERFDVADKGSMTASRSKEKVHAATSAQFSSSSFHPRKDYVYRVKCAKDIIKSAKKLSKQIETDYAAMLRAEFKKRVISPESNAMEISKSKLLDMYRIRTELKMKLQKKMENYIRTCEEIEYNNKSKDRRDTSKPMCIEEYNINCYKNNMKHQKMNADKILYIFRPSLERLENVSCEKMLAGPFTIEHSKISKRQKRNGNRKCSSEEEVDKSSDDSVGNSTNTTEQNVNITNSRSKSKGNREKEATPTSDISQSDEDYFPKETQYKIRKRKKRRSLTANMQKERRSFQDSSFQKPEEDRMRKSLSESNASSVNVHSSQTGKKTKCNNTSVKRISAGSDDDFDDDSFEYHRKAHKKSKKRRSLDGYGSVDTYDDKNLRKCRSPYNSSIKQTHCKISSDSIERLNRREKKEYIRFSNSENAQSGKVIFNRPPGTRDPSEDQMTTYTDLCEPEHEYERKFITCEQFSKLANFPAYFCSRKKNARGDNSRSKQTSTTESSSKSSRTPLKPQIYKVRTVSEDSDSNESNSNAENIKTIRRLTVEALKNLEENYRHGTIMPRKLTKNRLVRLEDNLKKPQPKWKMQSFFKIEKTSTDDSDNQLYGVSSINAITQWSASKTVPSDSEGNKEEIKEIPKIKKRVGSSKIPVLSKRTAKLSTKDCSKQTICIGNNSIKEEDLSSDEPITYSEDDVLNKREEVLKVQKEGSKRTISSEMDCQRKAETWNKDFGEQGFVNRGAYYFPVTATTSVRSPTEKKESGTLQ